MRLRKFDDAAFAAVLGELHDTNAVVDRLGSSGRLLVPSPSSSQGDNRLGVAAESLATLGEAALGVLRDAEDWLDEEEGLERLAASLRAEAARIEAGLARSRELALEEEA